MPPPRVRRIYSQEIDLEDLCSQQPAGDGRLSMIGLIGGTGLYQMDELQVTDVREITTPFGAPSSPIVLGMLQGKNVAFLARHGLSFLTV
jgi:purine nucleoside phosphorylase